ncbi:hypothetical protein DFH08DRAFT_1073951 [Mycena albidolilacea]|uniref:Uncharacterized protein n=1 Tax=Mycena albidolilacea TaxID=1033008 RepID=A0AAD7F1Z0_9AGAR|nr:hypothetical protein DFH08DRAFT_1073951 [Mycena albidolilacea]
MAIRPPPDTVFPPRVSCTPRVDTSWTYIVVRSTGTSHAPTSRCAIPSVTSAIQCFVANSRRSPCTHEPSRTPLPPTVPFRGCCPGASSCPVRRPRPIITALQQLANPDVWPIVRATPSIFTPDAGLLGCRSTLVHDVDGAGYLTCMRESRRSRYRSTLPCPMPHLMLPTCFIRCDIDSNDFLPDGQCAHVRRVRSPFGRRGQRAHRAHHELLASATDTAIDERLSQLRSSPWRLSSPSSHYLSTAYAGDTVDTHVTCFSHASIFTHGNGLRKRPTSCSPNGGHCTQLTLPKFDPRPACSLGFPDSPEFQLRRALRVWPPALAFAKLVSILTAISLSSHLSSLHPSSSFQPKFDAGCELPSVLPNSLYVPLGLLCNHLVFLIGKLIWDTKTMVLDRVRPWVFRLVATSFYMVVAAAPVPGSLSVRALLFYCAQTQRTSFGYSAYIYRAANGNGRHSLHWGSTRAGDYTVRAGEVTGWRGLSWSDTRFDRAVYLWPHLSPLLLSAPQKQDKTSTTKVMAAMGPATAAAGTLQHAELV